MAKPNLINSPHIRTLETTDLFHLYERIYSMTSQPSAAITICANCTTQDCELSEGGEVAILLPDEHKFIYSRLAKIDKAVSMENVKLLSICNGLCPFLKGTMCSIHSDRPFDCRSYPIVPRFGTDGTVEFTLSTICPHRAFVTESFVATMLRSWSMLFPVLDKGWRAQYNSVQPELEPLPARFYHLVSQLTSP